MSLSRYEPRAGERSWTEIASARTTLFDRALALNMPDFEDAIQAAHAESCGAHLIVTGNTADFHQLPSASNDTRGLPRPLRRQREPMSCKFERF